MALPSFDNGWREGQSVKPRILVLEIKDKDRPDDKALGWVLVEREETYRRDPRDGTIYEASIRLSYQRITASFRTGMVEKGGLMAATRATSTLCR
jgi:hypothetical protein